MVVRMSISAIVAVTDVSTITQVITVTVGLITGAEECVAWIVVPSYIMAGDVLPMTIHIPVPHVPRCIAVTTLVGIIIALDATASAQASATTA